MTEPLRFTKQDLVAQGVAPDKPWKDYTTPEKAAVTREHVARQNEIKSIENMEVFDRAALYAIAKRDGTPIGRATKEQLAEARQQGAIDRQENAKGLAVATAQGKMDGPIGESDAFKYINPKTGEPADPLMTPRQAMAQGYRLMDKPQQATIRNARTSLSYVNRLHTVYFGGKDVDGSITGTVGADFEGIYPAVEKVRNANQHLSARAQNTLALRTGILLASPSRSGHRPSMTLLKRRWGRSAAISAASVATLPIKMRNARKSFLLISARHGGGKVSLTRTS